MNARIRTAIAVVAALCVALSAYAKNDARADITLTDGTVIENAEFNASKAWGNKLKYEIGGEKHELKTDDIVQLVMWHVDAPENKALIRQLKWGSFKHKNGEYKTEKYPGWFVLESAGKHLAYWVRFEQAKVKANRIDFTLPQYGTPYFFQKSGDTTAWRIAYDPARPGLTRDWMCVFLSDDPAVCAKISEKGYFNRRESRRHGGTDVNPFFFEDIAVDYSPAR